IHTSLQPSGHAGHVPLNRGIVKTRSGHRVTAANGQEAFTHDLDVRLRHRLPPRLDKAFGGSTGRVDVEVVRAAPTHAFSPLPNFGVARVRVGVASSQPAFDAHDAEDDAVAEVNNLLHLI